MSARPPDTRDGKETIVSIPRLVVSSSKGRAGKTLATMAVLSALTHAGRKVCAFKNGPDILAPGHHAAILGAPSRNLDVVLMGEKVLERFYRYSLGFDIAVVEGNHGLYDSPDGRSEVGSTAQLARLLGAPVVLVVDGERVNRTAGAVVRGLRQFDPRLRFAGAILTNVVARQFDRLTGTVESEGLPVIGILPRDEELIAAMVYRHLGLVPMAERRPSALVDLVERRLAPRIDAPRLMALVREGSVPVPVHLSPPPGVPPSPVARVGILAGRPFTFYYPEMLERARELGTVTILDPETDSSLPALDLLVIGGGFPEVYAESLERNRPFRSAVRQFAERGGRIYAECGGLMYLTDSIVRPDGEFAMVGVIEGVTHQERRPIAHGHATARVERDTLIAPRGTLLRGHEFHYSWVELKHHYDLALAYDRGQGLTGGRDGIQVGNVYAHYLHLHPASYPVLDHLLLPRSPVGG